MTEEFLQDVKEEYQRAVEAYPDPNPSFKALISEVGELAESLIDLERYDEIDRYEEAVQVAVMAMRIAKEETND